MLCVLGVLCGLNFTDRQLTPPFLRHPPAGRVSQKPRSRSLVPRQRLGTRKLSLTDDHLDRQLGIQVLAGNQKSRQHVGGSRGRQDVGGPGPAGTAVFQTAYGLHDQLSATLRADALRAEPDNNAGQPAGLIPVYTNAGHRPDALRGAELPPSHAARL